MKKTLLFLLLSAGFVFGSCSQKDKLDEAFSKAVSCAELGTVEYTITKLVIADDDAFYKFGDRKIIFSCTTTMKAGIDLKDFKREDVVASKDGKSVDVQLPQPKILSFNMSAEDINQKSENCNGDSQSKYRETCEESSRFYCEIFDVSASLASVV